MTDPIAEAAANLAKQHAEPTLIEEIKEGMHDLAEKVEHLIHPETVPNVMPGSPAIADSATLSDVSGTSIETASSAKPLDALSTEAPAPASATVSSEPSTSIPTSLAGSEAPNVLPASTSGIASESTTSVGSGLTAEAPNAVLAAAGITGENSPSAPAASTSVTAAGEIRTRIASIKHHLSIRGFEQSAVADIHAELDAIEKWL